MTIFRFYELFWSDWWSTRLICNYLLQSSHLLYIVGLNTLNNESSQLQRGLKNRHIQLIAMGGAIGTGLFLGSAQVIQSAGPSIILGYAIAGFIAFLIMRRHGSRPLSVSEASAVMAPYGDQKYAKLLDDKTALEHLVLGGGVVLEFGEYDPDRDIITVSVPPDVVTCQADIAADTAP